MRVRRSAELALGVALLGAASWLALSDERPGQAQRPVQLGTAAEAPSRVGEHAESSYRLRIPRLAVDAPIVAVGIEDNGVLGVPGDPAEIGWWSDGPIPGSARGTSILAGHVNTANRGPGALIDVESLKPGDEIVVEGWDGPVTFIVDRVVEYAKTELPDDAFAQSGQGRLALVSCSELDAETGQYRNNVIVYAKRLNP